MVQIVSISCPSNRNRFVKEFVVREITAQKTIIVTRVRMTSAWSWK